MSSSDAAPQDAFDVSTTVWSKGSATTTTSVPDLLAAFRGEDGVFFWSHVNAHDRDKTAKFLLEELGFHPLAVEDALFRHERPGVLERPDCLFLEAIAISECAEIDAADLPKTDDEEAQVHLDLYSQVSFFLGKRYLITVSVGEFPLLVRWKERCSTEEYAADKGPAMLLYNFLDDIVDDYFPATDSIQNQGELLEDAVFARKLESVEGVLDLKRRMLEMRRRLAPIRDAVNTLLRRDITLIPTEIKPYFQDIYDHSLRLIEVIDLNRDILAAVMDAQLNITSNRLNDVMRKLTVGATILMSMSLVAGIYGMNFKFMPELNWPYGYLFAWGLMATVAVVEYMIFRWRKYI